MSLPNCVFYRCLVLLLLFGIWNNAYGDINVIEANQLPLELTAEQKEWLDAHPKIKVGAMNDWPPLNFLNLSGGADGFGVALISALNQRLGGRLVLSHGDWPTLYNGVIAKQLDVVMDITPKPYRQQYFNFTKPYLNIPHVIVARTDQGDAVDEQSLKGSTIALEEGFGNVNHYRDNFPDIDVKTYKNTSLALGAVARGEADAYIGNRAVAQYLMRNELLSNLKVYGRAEKIGAVLALGVRKDWEILASILDVALNSISEIEKHAILDDLIKRNTAVFDNNTLARLTNEERKWLDDHQVIRLASDVNWPPFEYFDESGRYRGVASDYIRLIERKLGVTFIESPQNPWHEIVDKVKHRELDMFSLAMETPQRSEYALFTQPYVSNAMVVVTKNNIEFVPGVDGLFGKTIALESGYASLDLISHHYPELKTRTYTNSERALTAVARGEAFAYIGNIATTSYIIQENGLTNLRVSGEIPLRFELSMGVRNDWPELVSILNKALSSITAQERATIFSKWVKLQQVEKQLPWIGIFIFIAIAILIILVVLYWNYILNRTVKERTHLLEYQAQHDALTDLPNRTALITRLEQHLALAERDDEQLAVLFIDLDDFKKVNDTLGHSVGDNLLKAVAERLRKTLRRSDVISRFGGDEFVIVIGGLIHPDDIEVICCELLKAIKAPYKLGNRNISMSLSIGIARFPNDGLDAEALLQNADTAMYASKYKGGDHFHFFSGHMNAQVHRRMLVEEELLKSLENKEIELHYQPIMDLKTNQPVKFEALSRWHSKRLGSVCPVEFINVAEHNGFILQLGDYVLEAALNTCQRLRADFRLEFGMAVNVSPRQLREGDFVKRASELLERIKLPAECLVMEITEGVLIKHQDRAEEMLAQLTDAGIKLAMDDFGTGYSSLSYIRKYPFSTLKIDREFVQDITHDRQSYELIESIVAMAKSMHIEVVAEGVETLEQHQKLKEIQCDKAQGYYYSRPLKEADLYKWLEEREV